MASPLLMKLTSIALMWMVLGSPMAEGALSCGAVQFAVAPCLGYLRAGGGAVPAACCNGARSVYNQAKTTLDRQGVCRCLKSVVNFPGLNLATLAALPGKCGINLPYKVTPSVDCNKCDKLSSLHEPLRLLTTCFVVIRA
ncbi:non-specific lipid-transfer protein 1-like [Abrus precatorius]|uniref:Non-specific lipid-transfer protein n=1 Tax=Abrus precatorius TaxID=3816 RepID=A0A8B8L9E0_ABRPR|nr:non-specific lipid-transfer protein 1-like [Abrus precatorius]